MSLDKCEARHLSPKMHQEILDPAYHFAKKRL